MESCIFGTNIVFTREKCKIRVISINLSFYKQILSHNRQRTIAGHKSSVKLCELQFIHMLKQLCLILLGLIISMVNSMKLEHQKKDVELTDEDIQQGFQNFKRKYNRQYTGRQYGQRKAAFAQSLKEIRKLQKASPSARFGLTKFADWLPSEKEMLLGYKEDVEESMVNILRDQIEEAKKYQQSKGNQGQKGPKHFQASNDYLGLPEVDIPQSLDWRDSGNVSPIKDQGKCGSCWAFAGIGHLQALFSIHDDRDIDLSEQWALQCSHGGGCWGGMYWAVIGHTKWDYQPIKTQAQYPYHANNYQFLEEQICENTPEVRFGKKKVTGLAIYQNPSDQLMKRILVRQGPFAASLNANGFFYYDGGVLDCSSLNLTGTNHAILVVGYDQDGNWIIKNSWGTDKEGDGYITVSKNGNCNLGDAAEIYFEKETVVYDDISGFPQANYRVELLDSYGDGWNGNIVGIRQNGVIIHQLGPSFTKGKSIPSFMIPVYTNLTLEVVVVNKASWSYECGYKIYDENDNLVIERIEGKSSFSSNGAVLNNLKLPQVQTVSYYVQLSSSGAEGYQRQLMGFVQDGEVVAQVGHDFKSGATAGPYEVKLKKGYETHLTYTKRIYKDAFIGITLKDASGNLLYSVSPGVPLYGDYVYYTFCAGCE